MPAPDLSRYQTFGNYAKAFPSKRPGKVGVTVSYLHQLRKAGKLPVAAVQIDRVWFVDKHGALPGAE